MTRRAKHRRGNRAPDRAGAGAPERRSRGAGSAASRVKNAKALAEYRARELRLKRLRTLVGFLGFVPLAGSLACDGGLLLFCVPWSWYMGLWAAVFGAFVGLSIRLFRERRRFEAQQPRAT